MMQYFAKFRLNPAVFALAVGSAASGIHRSLWRSLGWLFLVAAATAVMVALATSVAQAHDQAYCDGDAYSDHYIEDVNSGPAGKYMMWAESSHDHLIVKGGDGVSNVRVVRHDSNNFVYSGVDVTVFDDKVVFKVFYETSKVGAVLKICFEDRYGSWHPKDDDGNFEALTNFAPQTQHPPIPRQDLEIDDGAQTVDLSTHFFDPDDDPLTYTADSQDTTKATTSVSGSTLTITPVATGVTTVTVTVTASDGTESEQTSFTVVVYDEPPLRTDTEMSGIVDPYAETSVTADSLTVKFPANSMPKYYQARIDPESDDCSSEPPSGNEYLCLSVDLFDLAANPIDEGLDQEGKMVLTLDQTQATAVQTGIDANTFNLYKGDGTANSWSEIMKCPDPVGTSECYSFETTGSGGAIEVINISGFSDFTTTIPTSEDEQTIVDPPPTPEPPKPTKRPTTTTTNTETVRPRTNQRPRLDIDDDSLRYPENGTGPVASFDGSDPDDDDLTWHVDGLDSRAFKISDEGVLRFKTSPDFESPSDRDENNRYEIRVRVADDGSPKRSDSQDVRIRVTNQNEIGDINGDTEVSTPEGQTGLLTQYQAEDPEDDSISWSLGGPDVGAFQIDEEGNLSLAGALDYETPSSAAETNVHSLTIIAVDDGSPQMSSQLNVAVTVMPRNELGAISGETEVSTPEGHTGVLTQYQVDDPENGIIAWSVGGPDAANFQIDQEGNLLLESVLDFETPASAAETNVHSLTITAVDDGSPQLSSQLNVAVTVSNVNEAPVSAQIPGIELTVGDSPAVLNIGKYFTDPDGDALTYTLSGSDDSNVASATLEGSALSISPAGAGSLSFDLSGADAGGLSATTTANVTVVAPIPVEETVVAPTPVEETIVDSTPVRTLDPNRDYDEIIRPITTQYKDYTYIFAQEADQDPASTSDLEQTTSATDGLTSKPILTVSLRRLPTATPVPTMAAPAQAAPTPTAAPTPIRSSESRPTPAAQPTQPASQAPSSTATRQPAVAAVEKPPAAPQATAAPAPEPTTTAAEDESSSWLPLWLIVLLILLALLLLASMPLWIVNLLIVAGLVALAMALASVALWLIILVAIACLIVLAFIGILYGIITRGW